MDSMPTPLAAARVVITRKRPYYTDLLWSLIPVKKSKETGLHSLAVDRWGRLYYNEETISHWRTGQAVAGLLHEMNHVLRRHCDRSREHEDKFILIGGTPYSLPNVAQDMEIHGNNAFKDDLADFGETIEDDWVTPGRFGLPDNKLSEEYCELLLKKLPPAPNPLCGQPGGSGKSGKGAAANPPDIAAGGHDLTAPLANRFRHWKMELDRESWINEFPSYWDNPPTLSFDGLPPLSEEVWLRARAMVAGYARVRPTALHKLPDSEALRGEAWQSPRSWDYASRMIAEALDAGEQPSEALPDVETCIGASAAAEFMVWLKSADLPDPYELLDDPRKFKLPKRGDLQFVVLRSVGEAARGKIKDGRSKEEQRIWSAACTIMTAAAEQGALDVGVVAVRDLIKKWNTSLERPVDMMRYYMPLLKSANMMEETI